MFAFTRTNFILVAIGMAIVIVGLVLMSGAGSTESAFNADIFSPLRIRVAPAVTFLGFVWIIAGIMYKKRDKEARP